MSTAPREFVDQYEVLGVPADSPPDAIKAAYYEQVKKWHPDKFSNASKSEQEEANRRTIALNQAYRILSEPVLREKHDNARNSHAAWKAHSEARGASPGGGAAGFGTAAAIGLGILEALNHFVNMPHMVRVVGENGRIEDSQMSLMQALNNISESNATLESAVRELTEKINEEDELSDQISELTSMLEESNEINRAALENQGVRVSKKKSTQTRRNKK